MNYKQLYKIIRIKAMIIFLYSTKKSSYPINVMMVSHII